jgi:hypothetical protein
MNAEPGDSPRETDNEGTLHVQTLQKIFEMNNSWTPEM